MPTSLPAISIIATPEPESSPFPAFRSPSPLSPIHEESEYMSPISWQKNDASLYGLAFIEDARAVLQANTGMFYIALSQLFLILVNTAVKALNEAKPPISTMEVIWARMVVTYVCCIGWMFLTKVPDPILGPPGVRLLLWLRGYFGFIGLFGVYFSLESLSLSDATVLTFLSPMVTAILGALLLGESYSAKQAWAGVISFTGVVLIARPAALFGGYDSKVEGIPATRRAMAVGVSLIGVLGVSGAYIALRAIGTKAHALHSLSFFALQCVIISSIGMLRLSKTGTPFYIPTTWRTALLLSVIGFLGFVGQLFLAMGLQRETASRGTMALYTQIVFAVVLEALVFHTLPGIVSITGACLIMGSALYVALMKKEEEESAEDPIRLRRLSSGSDDTQRGLLSDLER